MNFELKDELKVARYCIGLGLFIGIVGRMMPYASPARPIFYILGPMISSYGFTERDLTLWISTGFYIWGIKEFAVSKGYSPLYGILGFVHSGGVALIFMLPDKIKTTLKVKPVEGKTETLIVPPPQDTKAAA
jgi:hypothetical protein